MKRVIDVLSILGILATPIVAGTILLAEPPTPNTEALRQETVAVKFPLDKPQVVDFQIDQGGFHRLTQREQLDQLRDWLLFTVASNSGLSASEINQSLYDTPVVRYGYMQPVANFEYGTTRSLYIGNDQVIALLPAGLKEAERSDALADITDRHRKDLGKTPKSLLVFEYDLKLPQRYALLTQRKSVDAKTLFRPNAGYYETPIKTQADLERFMGQINDITFAEVRDSTLVLGGRKLQSRPYGSIRVEDVAAIWQSDQSQSQGSGFSLDPQYDYTSLLEITERAAPSLLAVTSNGVYVVSEAEINAVKQGLAKKDVVPYLTLVEKLNKTEELRLYTGSAEDVNEFLRAPRTTSFQTARYDGNLQGTEVGMVLFYTDLLAKLWAFDYLGTTPEKEIPDFVPYTRVKVSSIYQAEIERLRNTRLWFGVQDQGFQVADEGKQILFARNASRIYAASSNPLKPGDETTAAAITSAFLTWWNNHYEEVARHEPQYERLNEIMKWSLLVNWLNQANQGSVLSFLQEVQVKKNHWFPAWAKANSQLRFQQWDQVGFYPTGYKGTKTEAMPLLYSETFQRFGQDRVFWGGVSLGNRNTFANRATLPELNQLPQLMPKTDKIPDLPGVSPPWLSRKPLPGDNPVTLSLRSNLEYGAIKLDADGLNIKTLEGTNYQLKPLNNRQSRVIAKAKEGTKFRNPEAQLANLDFSRELVQTSDGLRVETTIGKTELGTFRATRTHNGFTVGFHSRDLDQGQALALRLSKQPESLEVALVKAPEVKSVVRVNGDANSYWVELQDSKQWLEVTELGGGGGQPPTKPPPDWQLLVGDPEDGARNFKLAWVDEDTVTKQLASGKAKAIRYKPTKSDEIPDPWLDDLHNQPYEKTAAKLADNPLGFLQAKELHLKLEINKVDRLIATDNFDAAVQHIDGLIKIYGNEPKLVVRKAVSEIGRGRLKISEVIPGQAGTPKNNQQAFLREIKRLLDQKTSFKRVDTQQATLYVQDSPSLNNIDWILPPQQAVSQTSPKAKLYELQPGDIIDMKLSSTGAQNPEVETQPVANVSNINVSNWLNLNANQDDRCSETPENCNADQPIYIVIEPSRI